MPHSDDADREPENAQEKMSAAAYAAYKKRIIESGRDFERAYDSEDLVVFTWGYAAACEEPKAEIQKIEEKAYAAYKRVIIESGRDFDRDYDSEELAVFASGYEAASLRDLAASR